ncbi:fengycin family lipopeptide synthetase D/tyrocidine synthetase-3 [Ruminiclostridium sufflavum DSM 19573]|uniref:Fengycin family lipopeptide synthetase D/tyrocidine synthetase-3 n=1 Tax=Ruminiclostridium sufflavum DSM 19573 TaxID=1121337 RepID=A0A318XMP0_9FIRM|nr:non-ribosomal peptide synthetase [Ruminiclostridium sufflavum]PYG87829.1 fengycin family lipopeptide synthetase D/tyrocidine synthetase-3 [Ruminiclostridium sufflavum DSM 19573]
MKSLADILKRASLTEKGITFINGEEDKSYLSYRSLYNKAHNYLFLLQNNGLKAGDELIIQLEDNESFICIFWACILGGIIPVPLTQGGNDEHRLKVIRVWQSLLSPYMVSTSDAYKRFKAHMQDSDEYSRELEKPDNRVVLLDEQVLGEESGEIYAAGLESTAFLQFSSGSTGIPKGVLLSHENLLTNIRAIVEGTKCTEEDSTFSWMPLTHDMGLIGFHLSPVYGCMDQYIMPAALFIRRPSLWMDKVAEYGASVLSSPNFGYKYLLDHIKGKEQRKWDLSCVKLIFNGAEPIDAHLCKEFSDKMSIYGLRNNTMFCVYGLAEASLGVAFPPVNEPIITHRINRKSLNIGEYIEYSQSEDSISFVDLGYPVRDCSVAVFNSNYEILEEGCLGYVLIKGKNVTKGYYNNEIATGELINNDGWLNTGDLGFVKNGRLVIAGRAKDIIFINGQNFYAHDIERIIYSLEGIELGTAAACGVYDGARNKEQVCIFIIFKKNVREFAAEAMKIKAVLNKQLGLDEICVIPVKKIPKTTSGKIQRFKLRESYMDGEFSKTVNELEEYIFQYDSQKIPEKPVNEIENRLAEIWTELLDLKAAGVNENFFELGGNSLKGALLLNRVYEEFNSEIAMADFFEACTIRELAALISVCEKREYSSIKPAGKREFYPLSSAQKRMYLLSQTEEAGTNYNMPYFMIIDGQLDVARVEAAFRGIADRHEILRTSFFIEEGKPVQKVEENIKFEVPCKTDKSKNIDKIAEEFIRPFNLNEAPLMRVELVSFSRDRHLLMFDMHHIISDGTTMGIIIKEFSELYAGNKPPRENINYKDYAVWEKDYLTSAYVLDQRKYWINRFSDEIPVLNLPTDYARPKQPWYKGERIRFALSAGMNSKINKLSEKYNATSYMVLLAAYNILLSRYSGQQDIIVGSPVLGRPRAELANTAGMFVNSLAMRNHPDGELTFTEFLEGVRKNSLDAFANQSYQYDNLLEELDITADSSRNPLFDTMFSLQNMELGEISIEGLGFTRHEYETGISKFDLTLLAEEKNGGLEFEMEYKTSLFNKKTIERMASHFINIISEITENPDIRLSEIRLISSEEQNQLLYAFNQSKTCFPKDKTLSELFERQVCENAGRTALVFGSESITYDELNVRANKLARTLRKKGLKANCIAALLVNRSIDMIVTILAVLKTGSCYLPVDTANPKDRVLGMMEDSGADMLIVHRELGESAEGTKTEVYVLEELLEQSEEENGENTDWKAASDSPAYIMYTSGSSGKPKGNITTHYNISRVVKNTNYIDITNGDTLLQLSNYAFDGSTFDIFGALLNGARLVLVDKDTLLDMNGLADLIENNKVTMFFITTALFNTLVDTKPDSLQGVKKILFGGERVSVRHVQKALGALGPGKLMHVYGPTESTVFATCYNIDRIDDRAVSVPVGRPVTNTRLFVVDKYNRLQPVGVPGELCISGDGLAKGYLNRPGLTAEKFVSNPFCQCSEEQALCEDNRMYRTGDLVKWLPDGNIEFLDRIDSQVKLRGFRIELSEIERTISDIEGVKKVFAAITENETGSRSLCAYIVFEGEFSCDGIKEQLSEKLPDFMVPDYFILMDSLPVNANGKVDRRKLPGIEKAAASSAEYIPPENNTQERLQAIWTEVLGTGNTGIDSRFSDIGGQSLKAAVIISRIYKEFNRDVPLKVFFKAQTIRNLADIIDNAEEKKFYALAKAGIKDWYPLTAAQKGLFVQEQFEGIGISYNMPVILSAEGELDTDRAVKCFLETVQRHEALRTCFETVDGIPVQKISEKPDLKVIMLEGAEDDTDAIIRDFVRPFDLGIPPMMRVQLVRFTPVKYLLMIDMHHIISDGISVMTVLQDFGSLYNGEVLEPVQLHYKDFAEWQKKFLLSEKARKQEKYWENVLGGELPLLNMPYDYTRADTRTFDGDSLRFTVDRRAVSALKRIASQESITLNSLLMSVYAVMLNKYTAQREIMIGSLVSGRNHPDIESMVGMFNNFLPVKLLVSPEISFVDFAVKNTGTIFTAYENQDYPYNLMVERFGAGTEKSRNPFFDTMLIYHNQFEDVLRLQLNGLKIHRHELKTSTSKLDLKLDIYNTGEGGFDCFIEYNTNLFKNDTVNRMSKHFTNILNTVIANPGISLKEIDMVTQEEKHQILRVFNDTRAEYPKDKTINSLFRQQAAKTPEAAAVSYGSGSLSYSELDESSDILAAALRKRGACAEKIIGVMIERSLEMSTALMAVLKSGAAYLPISPDYPSDRIRFMLEDSEAVLLITQDRFLNKIAGQDIISEDKIVNLNAAGLLDSGNNETGACDFRLALEEVNNSRNPAYVIYTSGSTGIPKGVVIEHYSLVNRLNWMQKRYPVGKGDVILQKTPYTFDVSVWEQFWWALNGAAVHFLEPGEEKDPEAIVRAIEENKITVLHFVPSMLNIFLEYAEGKGNTESLKSLRQVFASGEALSARQVNRFNRLLLRKNGTRLHNLYGPTEAAIDVSYFDCSSERKYEEIPIGKPIDNINLYILDESNRLCPAGVPGELCIAGDGLARGYLNRAGLEAEKFVQSPFCAETGYQRMYRSGDAAKWRADGNIQYLGRLDFQVKIRGNRIEPGEIEAELLKHKSIKAAVVAANDNADGSKYLCAYYVSDKELPVKRLRSYLAGNLAEYMIPSYFVRLDKIPLSANGKADRKALPKPEGTINTGTEYCAPETDAEIRLAAIWREILNIEKAGIDDNFFDLGGHSLKATEMVSRIYKEFGVTVKLRDIFSLATIRSIAENIGRKGHKEFQQIKAVSKRDYYKLSSSQKRIYLLSKIEDGGTAYNLPGALMLEGEFQPDRFRASFGELINRHETLRTSFHMIDGQPVQAVHDNIEFDIDLLEAGQAEMPELLREFVKPFDLSRAPLIRARLVRISRDKHILMYDMHHIVSDGFSSVILVRDFAALYTGKKPEELKITYKDYSEWQESLFEKGGLYKQEEYWLNTFKGDIPVLNMPADYIRPAIQRFSGRKISMEIPKDTASKVRKLEKSTGITLYMIMLAAYNILLAGYTGQEDIIVGCPVAGRQHADLENIIGMFVNTVAIRNKPEAGKRIRDFLGEVKERSIEAFENQQYPFEELVNKLKLNKDLSRNPLFDTMFVLQNIGIPDMDIEGLKFSACNIENKVSKFDLTVEAIESGNTIRLNLEYSTSLFKEETIIRLAGHYINILEAMYSDSEKCIGEINMISEEEKNQILKVFNDTKAEYPKKETINSLFRQQAAKTPDKKAVTFGGLCLTYRELDERSDMLALTLRKRGAGAEKVAAVMIERSLEMSVALMAVLKAGAAYLPISPDYPADRIRFMLEDSGSVLLITQERFLDKIKEQKIISEDRLVNLNSAAAYSGSDNDDRLKELEAVNNAGNPAYIIYTSGSTGKPKGVVIEHYSLINRLNWMQKMYPVHEGDVILQKTPYTFDVSVWEQFWWALNGAAVHFLEPGGEKDPEAIVRAIEENKITTMHFVPSMLNMFLEYADGGTAIKRLKSLKQVFASGEALTAQQVEKFNRIFLRENGTRLHNLYGPTEAAIDVSYFDCSIDKEYEAIPIGKPIDNINLYIVDKNKRLCPVGVPGELCIAGDGLARGYLNREELTAEKFVKNPFYSDTGYRLMYKSGDLARWMPDGNIHYLGRIDFQVKIRGNRIELGEIEAELLKHEGIKDAAVAAVDCADGSKCLCAYYTAEEELAVNGLRAFLAENLTEYMLPSYFIRLDKIPLSSNGKADRKALPKPEGLKINTGTEYKAAQTETEKKLEALWKEILNINTVGVNDNFFDLGGNSLLLVRMHSKLEEKYKDSVKITDLFTNTCISRLARFIDSVENPEEKAAPVKTILPEDYFKTDALAEAAGSSFGYQFRKDMYERIKGLDGCEGFEPGHILTALLAHLLHQITKQSVININIGHGDEVYPVRIDTSGANQLCELAKRARDSMRSDAVKIIDAAGINIDREKNEILILVNIYNNLNSGSYKNIFDLIIDFGTINGNPVTHFDFNGSVLKASKVKELGENYIRFINAAIMQKR